MSLIKSFALLALVALAAGQVQIKTKVKKFQPAVAQNIISREVCGDVYETGTGGSIISPNYPTGYNNGDSCGWFLTAENGNRIAVVIHNLDTESGFDVLTILDGVTGESPVLVELSGQASNFAVLSTQPSIFVGFTSDSSVNGPGFNASWTQVNPQASLELFGL
ncbi:hypothetical protein DAPPUDRAFT_307763 [Daphnia pulex]|uniref:CUB domain-containing protein n=1 Tax=Daphnia pulex TaxID=6669 RepID=E9G1R3_DAPPU|nr:hypothetical protein DAPPUDRAFT_307763 [Daphnia pulex]|eukprot:EFX86770.1 hypothetical protein DAPPUDRAFT_307763 [Daphnia pulex]